MYTPEQAKAIIAKLPPAAIEEYRKLAPHLLLYQVDEPNPPITPQPEPTPPPTPDSEQSDKVDTITALSQQLAALKEQITALTAKSLTPAVPGTPAVPPTPGTITAPATMADVDMLLKQYPLVPNLN